MKVTKKTTIQKALQIHPAVTQVFKKLELRCIGCGGAAAETLELCARTHGIDPDELVDQINRAISEKSN
ncbi:MAG: DUF1858 domain-containing protein [Candidatus Hydrogenedentes bacterium]|nr:DUF1858 domain-containing protein [Candidatus Hydrogenedentota bacterium]